MKVGSRVTVLSVCRDNARFYEQYIGCTGVVIDMKYGGLYDNKQWWRVKFDDTGYELWCDELMERKYVNVELPEDLFKI